jgi:DNA-binding transcriptional ArsR family regulator
MSLAHDISPVDAGFDATLAGLAAEMLKAVAHPLRLRILALLAENPENVSGLSHALATLQPIVSQQLRILRSHRLVGVTRRGGFATYWLAEPKIRSLLACVSSCLSLRARGERHEARASSVHPGFGLRRRCGRSDRGDRERLAESCAERAARSANGRRARRAELLRALLLEVRRAGARQARARDEGRRQPGASAVAREAVPARSGRDRLALRSRSAEAAAAARGEQVFREVSWSVALDEIAEKLLAVKRRHGPEALALFAHGFGGSWFKHLVQAYGTPNIGEPSYAQCRGPREAGYAATFGQALGSPEPIDIASARVITLIGSHLGENMHSTQVQDLAQALGRGAELVVVDPRFSTAAGKARYWLPIKPGTDIALLLAWMHVIITERRYDAACLEKHALGLDKLEKHVADKTPEWAWAITGIAAERIRESARFIAGARPASLIHPGRRATWYGDDTQRARAMAILAALLGSWGRRGGYIEQTAMPLPAHPAPPYPEPARAPADHPRGKSYPLAQELLANGLRDASIPGTADYDIKAWLVYGTNLIQTLPDADRTRKAIEELDLIVSIDVLPAEITGFSDVVLPECTYLERADDLWAARHREPFVALRQPAVEPSHDSKPGWWIARELGNRLGLGASHRRLLSGNVGGCSRVRKSRRAGDPARCDRRLAPVRLRAPAARRLSREHRQGPPVPVYAGRRARTRSSGAGTHGRSSSSCSCLRSFFWICRPAVRRDERPWRCSGAAASRLCSGRWSSRSAWSPRSRSSSAKGCGACGRRSRPRS